ncbi:MAG: hypothetical protein NTW30_02000 [Candidatus Aenigmarchaeota archaeon]|nr:hypothetical protein [Candidatus Aenigmarchaeota archaeon]
MVWGFFKPSLMKIVLFLLIFFFIPLPFYIPDQVVIPTVLFITKYMTLLPDGVLGHMPTFLVDFVLSYFLSSLLAWFYSRFKFLFGTTKKKNK